VHQCLQIVGFQLFLKLPRSPQLGRFLFFATGRNFTLWLLAADQAH
jgi:hypothetical protein